MDPPLCYVCGKTGVRVYENGNFSSNDAILLHTHIENCPCQAKLYVHIDREKYDCWDAASNLVDKQQRDVCFHCKRDRRIYRWMEQACFLAFILIVCLWFGTLYGGPDTSWMSALSSGAVIVAGGSAAAVVVFSVFLKAIDG